MMIGRATDYNQWLVICFKYRASSPRRRAQPWLSLTLPSSPSGLLVFCLRARLAKRAQMAPSPSPRLAFLRPSVAQRAKLEPDDV